MPSVESRIRTGYSKRLTPVRPQVFDRHGKRHAAEPISVSDLHEAREAVDDEGAVERHDRAGGLRRGRRAASTTEQAKRQPVTMRDRLVAADRADQQRTSAPMARTISGSAGPKAGMAAWMPGIDRPEPSVSAAHGAAGLHGERCKAAALSAACAPEERVGRAAKASSTGPG